MDGFKNTTKTQYMKGGSCEGYAKGGSVKGAAKISKVMGEFKAGKLHSGSKKGPEVTNPKQATAIALSEARKAGAKIPKVQKKSVGGEVDGARDARRAEAVHPAKRGPAGAGFNVRPIAGAPQQAVMPNRPQAAGMKKGGKVEKYAEGGWTGRGNVTIPLEPDLQERMAANRVAMRKKTAAAQKAKADEARYRRALGSDADILSRAGRSQVEEGKELRSVLGYKKGGLSAMPKGKGGKC